MAGASSDISEEMIKLSFFECFQTEPLPLFFASFFFFVFCFCFFVFFFPSGVQNRGAYYTRARIIHGQIWYLNTSVFLLLAKVWYGSSSLKFWG